MRISHLARQFGLTRGTLLHYDRLQLLEPAGRNPANYREYSKRDEERLRKICLLRKAGLSLGDIAVILDGNDELLTQALERRFAELDREMDDLRAQQELIAGLLKRSPDPPANRSLNWSAWVLMVKTAGLTLDDLKDWHGHFERASPTGHRRFLDRLRIPVAEWNRLERWGLAFPPRERTLKN
jgi:MerR family transcriptional regulator, thiopeptide resistance regulator